MRYQRIQEILEKDPALGRLLSPKNQPIDSRFGEKICYSKEVVAVTQAIHAEGKDAQKLSKPEVLRVAMVVMKYAPGNFEMRAAFATPAPVAPTPAPPAPVQAAPITAPKRKAVTKPKAPEAPADQKPPVKPKAAAVQKPKVKPTETPQTPKSTKITKTAKNGKAEEEAETEPAAAQVSAPVEEDIPESELPPEKQPLRLPAGFDSTKWPHYDVQNSVYCLLLSALNLSEHFEKYPGAEDRQKKLESLLKDYLVTCDQIKVGS